ncbi:MAG: lipopolysaccharide biosynthesis protein [Patiriisocius sp.]|uniref:lipopolysaccharide biosynthesis protein n=1 Tax=Patiriisocius sp. TaxID=2822396 RepID=UPI003EFA81FE
MLQKINVFIAKIGLGGSKKSLHLAVSQSFVALLFILIDFIFSKQLSVAQFGVFKELFFVLNLGIPLLAFGLPEGFKYFIAKEDNLASYFKSLTGLLFSLGLLVLFILFILNALHFFQLIDIGYFYVYSLLFPLPLLAFLLNKVLRYSYINLDQAERLTKLSIYGSLASVAIIFGASALLNINQNLIAVVAIALHFSVFFFPALFYLLGIKALSFSLSFNKTDAKKFFQYGFPLYLATFAGILSVYLDKSIVSIMEDEATFAIFAVGAIEIPIFAMLSAAFSQQIFPSMVRYIENDDETAAQRLWMQTTKKVSLLTYPVILICMFFAKDIIFFIYSDAYQESIFLFKTYLLIALFRNNSYGILLTAKGETQIITKIALAMLLLNGIASITLFYFYGLEGIVYGSLVSTFFFTTTVLLKENLMANYIKEVFLSPIIFILTVIILFIYFFN